MTIPDANDGGATDRIDDFSSVLERDVDPPPTDRNGRLPRRAVQNRCGLEGRRRNPFLWGSSGHIWVERWGHTMQGPR